MIFVTYLFSILLLVFGGQNADKTSTPSPLERLRAKVAVESLGVADTPRLAGHYTNPPKDLLRRIGGVLSGDDLYLFPDGTYIYCEWADIQPLTIYDKGRWIFANGAVELKSDPDVTWDPGADRTDNPELTLLYVAKGRDSTITRSKTAGVKARLLRESWRPEYFKTNPTDHHQPCR